MRHRRRVKHFGRKTNQRKALIRGLVGALVKEGRICTTVEKAKELRRHIERAITVGKRGTLNAKRILLARYPNSDVAHSIWSSLVERFSSRNGGYTRIIKVGRRSGDSAELAFLEFVDFDFTSKDNALVNNSDQKKESKKEVLAAKRKVLRKIQSESRRFARS